MRERRTFAERTRVLHSEEPLKKYFLVYEGAETEAIYFNAVSAMREEARINPLIELVSIDRSYSEEGWSNPKKILNRVIENLEEGKTKLLTYESLLNRFMDYFLEAGILIPHHISKKGMWKMMSMICDGKLQKTLDSVVEDIDMAVSEISGELMEKYGLVYVVPQLSELIKMNSFTYEEGFDKICLIVDRDRESFVSSPENNQYEYVINTCAEKGFGLYISNPCFEFWLLLHFDEVFELDKEKLLNNPKVTGKRRYAEQELRRIWPGFEKSSYHAEKLITRIDKAIENEKKFCEELYELEWQVGSNVGLLIEDMRKREMQL